MPFIIKKQSNLYQAILLFVFSLGLMFFIQIKGVNASQITDSFTDSQGRTTLYRYSLQDGWNTQTPRGLLIYFHGNNSDTQEGILDMFFWSTEQDAYRKNLIPVVVTSPYTRDDGITRQWHDEDKLLIQELLQSEFKNAFRVDFNQIYFFGGSQGTCFLHDFIMEYGEQYGGGFYGGCGCFNAPDPLWLPSDNFKERFKIFIHTTTDDFLYESGQNGHAYYEYTLGMNTRGDLERAGTHCSLSNEVESDALDWLIGDIDIAEEPFKPHWQRISTMSEIKGAGVSDNGTLWVAQQSNDQQGILWRSSDQGTNWESIYQIQGEVEDFDIVADVLFLNLTSGLYRSNDQGKNFHLISDSSEETYITDTIGNLYTTWPLKISSDLGESWQLLDGIDGGGMFLFNVDVNPIIAYESTFNNQYFSLNFGNDWSILNDTILGSPFSTTSNGTTLWALSEFNNYYYRLFKSSNLSISWNELTLPNTMNEYYHWGSKISVLQSGNILIYGGYNASWLSKDEGLTWKRIPGAETVSYGNIYSDNSGNNTYLTDGEAIFRLILEPEDLAINLEKLSPIVRYYASPSSGLAPLTVTLDASSSYDPEGSSLVNFEWFINGEFITNISPTTYTFDSAGNYSVELLVTNNEGKTGNLIKQIQVMEKEISCSDKTCNYSISIDQPGFYIATVRLPEGSKEGVWGVEFATSGGINSGGFNSGAILKENGDRPGFMAFNLSQAEAVNITPYEYTGKVNTMKIQLSRQENGERTVVFGAENVRSGQTTTTTLQPGFYVAEAFSSAGSVRGRFGFEISAQSMIGGVNIGGWIDSYTGGNGEGFGGLYVGKSQMVDVNVFFGESYSSVGSDPIELNIYRKENGSRTLVFSGAQ